MKLTFEQIRKECEPMKHLLVSDNGAERLYLGFNRFGHLVTDGRCGQDCVDWKEGEIKDWTIKEYKPTRKVNAWEWAGYDSTKSSMLFLSRIHSIKEQHPDLEIEVEE